MALLRVVVVVAGAQSLDQANPGEEVLGLIPAIATHSVTELLVSGLY